MLPPIPCMFDGVRYYPSLVVTPDLKHPSAIHGEIQGTSRGEEKVISGSEIINEIGTGSNRISKWLYLYIEYSILPANRGIPAYGKHSNEKGENSKNRIRPGWSGAPRSAIYLTRVCHNAGTMAANAFIIIDTWMNIPISSVRRRFHATWFVLLLLCVDLPVIHYIRNYAISEFIKELIELIGKFTIFLPSFKSQLIVYKDISH